MSTNYQSVNRINTLKQSIETATGKTYTNLTKAIQDLKDSGKDISDFVKLHSNLGDVVLSDSIDELRAGAFAECVVDSIILPNGIEDIPEYCFYYLFFNKSTNAVIAIPDGVTSIGFRAFMNSDIKEVTISNTVTNIGQEAFKQCQGLTSVTIPDSVTTIGSEAFALSVNITNVLIGGTNLTIGDDAFCLNSKLQTVTFTNGTPAFINSTVFSNCSQLTTINVPWAEGEVANAPWGATKATINYNYTGG